MVTAVANFHHVLTLVGVCIFMLVKDKEGNNH